MGNKITDNLKTGTIGELLVQIRLLQFGVQAAPPIKDSGNDLIAIRGDSFRGIQVKTTAVGKHHFANLPSHYHILALVDLKSNDVELLLDTSEVYLVSREEFEREGGLPQQLDRFRLTQALVNELFQ